MRKIVVLAGPTAVGKTEVAIAVARRFQGEIVSADSMQIYRGMDVGSAKPTAAEREAAVHHLIDFLDPGTPFSVAEYQKLARDAIAEIFARGKLPVVCGGTGLYVNSILYEMDFSEQPADPALRAALQKMDAEALWQRLDRVDPSAAARIHPNNTKRLIRAIEVAESGSGKGIPAFSDAFKPCGDYEAVLIGLSRERAALYARIEARVDRMLEAGLEDEVRSLLADGRTAEDISMQGIGYKEMIAYLRGECPREEAIALIKQSSRRYAKRQLTWFRRYPEMRWFAMDEPDEQTAEQRIFEYLEAVL